MVRVTDFKTITGSDGKEFYALIVEGEAQPVLSNKTNRIYFTTRIATVPCTFDERRCRELIGTEFDGEVVRIECEPYEFIIKETGETIKMSHRWQFANEELQSLVRHMVNDSENII